MARRYRIRFGAALTALAAVIVIAAPVASGSASRHGVVVTASRIGPLRLDVSGPRAVLRFAGLPESGSPHSLQYGCFRHNGRVLCRINYFFGSAGKVKDRLIAAVISGGPFQSRNGTRVGMSASQARTRERKAIPTDFCGNSVLRHPPPNSTSSASLAGLNIGLARGKVAGFIVLSRHASISCFAGGGYFIRG